MKPLLAGEVTDPAKLKFPIYASPKYDGIRALVIDGQLVSRTLKPIPNDFIRDSLSHPAFNGFDGELIVGATFQETTSAVMSKEGAPRFRFIVFDDFSRYDLPYSERCTGLQIRVAKRKLSIEVAPHALCHSWPEVEATHEGLTRSGYEGTMLRSPSGIYKFGRSTEKEGILLKLKNFKDIEAEIVGFDELLHNDNPALKDNLGRTKRSSSKKNLVPAGTLGALVVHHPDFGEFRVGTGFDAALRQQIWLDRQFYLGKLAKIRYQPDGTKDKPRIPSFQGIRDPIDI